MKYLKFSIYTFLFSVVGLLSYTSELFAQSDAILGRWKAIDDTDGKPKSVIEIYKKDGMFYGKVIELLSEATIKDCQNCPGEKKGKSLLQMDIIWNLRYHSKVWVDGFIIDPKSGKIYDCILSLDNPNLLKVRGFIGISLFGRTQSWYREQ